MTYQYIDNDLPVRRRVVGHRPKQQLPRRDILRAAQQQRSTRPQPVVYDDDLDEAYGLDTAYAPPRMPAITRQYNTTIPRGTRIQAHPDEVQPAISKPRFKIHWLMYVGIALFLLLMGYILLTDLSNWWQGHQDDSSYGNPRTYQIDAVVGHNDSPGNPSHFIAVNLNGHISVTEWPGGDATKGIVYHFPTVIGNASNPPVTIQFQDFDNDGRMDMIVRIGDPPGQVTYMMQNNGTQFVNKS